MPVTFNEKLLAYLALFSGLVISVVAEYYSILGLTAIFSAAAIPVIIMGIALGVGKITATLWLKQNWSIAPWSIRAYLLSAIAVLMLITSMGIFGFLSKAHSDQSLVGGDVLAKIGVYDEKIKIARDNIEASRKALKQMDEAVDQVMGRSTSETGADKAVAIRKSQQKERAALLADIQAQQKNIASLNDEAAPIRAEIRKVEAEVGPIKYIASFIYGETDQTILEKAVTWVIIILIIVFDPLAVILLLASQISFQNFRDRERWDFERNLEEAAEAFNDVFADELENTDKTPEELMGQQPDKPDAWVADVGEKPTKEEKAEIEAEPPKVVEPAPVRTVITGDRERPRNKTKVFRAPKTLTTVTEALIQKELEQDIRHEVTHMGNGYIQVDGQMYRTGSIPAHVQGYIQNEEQRESGVWSQVKKNEE